LTGLHPVLTENALSGLKYGYFLLVLYMIIEP